MASTVKGQFEKFFTNRLTLHWDNGRIHSNDLYIFSQSIK